jgi:N-acetylmuramoyl-L-alanine amidase
MSFDVQVIHWPDVTAFMQHIVAMSKPAWCDSITNHNTYRPDEMMWAGLASMNSMMKTYIDKGWSSGPHLYLVASAPNPAHQGIWAMTPLERPGTHAGACNKSHIGIESCADWEARPPTPVQWRLMLDVNVAICRQWNIPASRVLVHKECMPGRTCPGRYFDPARMRAEIHAALLGYVPPPVPSPVKHYRVKRAATAGVIIRAAPRKNAAVMGRLKPGDAWQGEIVKGGYVTLPGFAPGDLWVEAADGRSVWASLLEEVKTQ